MRSIAGREYTYYNSFPSPTLPPPPQLQRPTIAKSHLHHTIQLTPKKACLTGYRHSLYAETPSTGGETDDQPWKYKPCNGVGAGANSSWAQILPYSCTPVFSCTLTKYIVASHILICIYMKML